MFPRFAIGCLLTVLLALSAAGASPAFAYEPPCIADWSDAAPIVTRERLASSRTIQDLARTRLSGDLVRITLCREESHFVYRIVMRDPRGRISSLTVDARQPFAGHQDTGLRDR
ncbi:MAG: PepSY domain-containing protein [Hyphomicrobiaceae bacterium]